MQTVITEIRQIDRILISQTSKMDRRMNHGINHTTKWVN